VPFVNAPPYGSIPLNVSTICQLTYMCTLQDIHPKPTGYATIAQAFQARLGGAVRCGRRRLRHGGDR